LKINIINSLNGLYLIKFDKLFEELVQKIVMEMSVITHKKKAGISLTFEDLHRILPACYLKQAYKKLYLRN